MYVCRAGRSVDGRPRVVGGEGSWEGSKALTRWQRTAVEDRICHNNMKKLVPEEIFSDLGSLDSQHLRINECVPETARQL